MQVMKETSPPSTTSYISISKINVQIISVYINTHVGKDKNNEFC